MEPEVTKQDLTDAETLFYRRCDDIDKARQHSTASFWKVITTLCTVIGILIGFLISDLRFMGQITETRVKVESLQRQMDDFTRIATQRFEELKVQGDQHYYDNQKLIQRVYDLYNEKLSRPK